MIDLLTVECQWQGLASGNLSGAVLPASPFQLVTLWDMLRFEARWFYYTSINLDRLICDLGIQIKARGDGDNITEAEAKDSAAMVESLIVYCDRLGLGRTKDSIDDILMRVKFFTVPPIRLGRVHDMLIHLRTSIARDLNENVFLFLAASDIKYYQQEQLFGPEVFTNFPSTRNDVAEAGNCYATGRHTASVFHCMRVVEKGLHALVNELNSKHNAGIVFRDKVEYENWGAIITEIQLALENPKRIKRLAPLPTKDEMTFYSKVAMESEYIKNAWRDDVAHSRSEYDQPGALSVMDHVEAFMKYLAQQGLTE